MIKKITIKNFKLFKEEVSVSFSNHGSKTHGLDFIFKNQISSLAGILGKNGSGKSSFLEGIRIYAKLTNPNLRSNLLKDEYLRYIFKELEKNEIPYEEGQIIIKEAMDRIKNNDLPKYIKGEEPIQKQKEWFEDNAFLEKEEILITVTYFDKVEIKHELSINSTIISEKIIYNKQILSSQRCNFIDFSSQILDILKDKSIETTKLMTINAHFHNVKRVRIKNNKDQKLLLNFVKISDENIQELFYSPKGRITSFIDAKTNKKIDVSFLSLGTKKIISIFPILLLAMKKSKSFVLMDEIENSIHLSIVKFIITLFKTDYNKMGSQLLFTTHNPLIFEDDFKNDSIYFIKNEQIIKNTMRFDKKITPGYLRGELISNPDHQYRFDFLEELMGDE